MATKTIKFKARKPKHFAGAGALISGGLQLGSSLLSAYLQKKQLEEQELIQTQAATKAINVGAASSADE